LSVLGKTDPQAYLNAVDPDELKALIELVVVPESWMFRDADAFVAMTRFVRERLAPSPARPLRILSLPCAGGEEPYSIAMALQDAGVALEATVIEAIDLSEVALDRARRARYTKNAFRGADLAFRDRHFVQHGAEYQLNESVRQRVSFSRGNLLALDVHSAAGRYDVIFCRNLLIYFDDATTAAAIARLRVLLADDGMLLAGYAEVPAFCSNGFAALRTPGAFALQKQTAAPAPTPPRAMRAHKPAAPPAPTPVRTPAPRVPARPVAAAPAVSLEQAERLAGQGDHAGAASACHAILKDNPNAAQAYFILGLVSECGNQRAMAGDYWRRCIYLQPDHYEALCHLALLAEQDGNAAQASAFKLRAARVYQRRDERAKQAR
jgi:chemotaxis protein methyltransferase WspC